MTARYAAQVDLGLRFTCTSAFNLTAKHSHTYLEVLPKLDTVPQLDLRALDHPLAFGVLAALALDLEHINPSSFTSAWLC